MNYEQWTHTQPASLSLSLPSCQSQLMMAMTTLMKRMMMSVTVMMMRREKDSRAMRRKKRARIACVDASAPSEYFGKNREKGAKNNKGENVEAQTHIVLTSTQKSRLARILITTGRMKIWTPLFYSFTKFTARFAKFTIIHVVIWKNSGTNPVSVSVLVCEITSVLVLPSRMYMARRERERKAKISIS